MRMNSMRLFGKQLIGITLLAAAALMTHAAELPGPLVTPAWLAQHASEVVILDVRDDLASFKTPPQFETDKVSGKKTLTELGGHLPGALLLDFSKIRVDRSIDGRQVKAMLPDRAAFETLMRDAGVTKGRPIVVTMPGQSVEDLDEAARTYWSLKVYGQNAIAILDGGVAGWIDSGQPVSLDDAAPARGDWQASAAHRELVAESQDVADAAASKIQLVDARPLPYYLGLQKKPIVKSAGHIAGAVDFPTDVVSIAQGPETHFLSADQYKTVFEKIGVKVQGPSITYCNTGHLAAGAWFVMSEVLGNKQVKLYDGSMHEWTLENRPVVGMN
jgi:thiosulfate/3-mercaptopyruvate sulfurtransferase